MAKTILLIEADDAFAASLTDVLEARGATVQRTGNGKEGLKLAEAGGLDAIILCVELPKMSGYAVCNKLKKSDDLKEIPLVIMSSEATPKTFDQHKKLKTRAEEYVIKPCEATEVAEKIDALIGLDPAGGEAVSDDDGDLDLLEDAFDSLEMTDDDETLEADDDDIEEIALDALEVTEDQVEEVDSADLAIDALGDDDIEMITESGEEADSADDAIESLGDMDSADEAIESLGDMDSADDAIESLGDMDSADDAIETLGMDDMDTGEMSTESIEVDSPSEPAASDAPAAGGATARRLAKLEEENASLRKSRTDLESKLAGVEDDLRAKTNELEAFRSGGGGGSKEALKLKSELTQKNKELLSLKETINEKEKAELAWQERETELELKAADLEEKALQSEAQAKTLGEKVEAQNERLEKLQSELEEAYASGRRASELEAELEAATQARDGLKSEVDELRKRAETAEQKTQELEAKIGSLNEELEQARAAAQDLEEKVNALLPLEEQVQTLEAENARNEERVLKAYQKLKGDEKLREKTRKALSVALDLLDEAPGLVDGSDDDLGEELQAESA
jgi:DNA-binding response OmpR family regulator/predicted  nucleic acid-binding Zn-ribbon protein